MYAGSHLTDDNGLRIAGWNADSRRGLLSTCPCILGLLGMRCRVAYFPVDASRSLKADPYHPLSRYTVNIHHMCQLRTSSPVLYNLIP